ncbi:MAG: NAD-glutamate dehydrogenase domain-containing protein [Parachlamydiaceae bacterium]
MPPTTNEKLEQALQRETEKFKQSYLWLEEAMPKAFFKEISLENLLLVTHSLMGFPLQDYYSTIHLKCAALVLSLDVADADLRILQQYAMYGIKNYQTFVSKTLPPFPGITKKLRVAHIIFTDAEESEDKEIAPQTRENLQSLVMGKNPNASQTEVERLIRDLSGRFLNSLSENTLSMALEMYFRAKTRDSCQYDVRYREDWQEKGSGSMQIVLAWKNIPKHNFLYRLARTIYRHQLVIKRADATYVNPYDRESILLMMLDLHGADGQPAEEVADIPEFLREFATVKYFASFDRFDKDLVTTGYISGNAANLLRAMVYFIHQALVHIDPNLYNFENVEEGLCRHPELTAMLTETFKWKFHPELHNFDRYQSLKEKFLNMVERLDTGQEENDLRRKTILRQGLAMVDYTLKTNAYRLNFTGLSFRLDPKYLDAIPFDRSKKFPELPYAIFFIKGMHYFGYHIRFKDLSRGGLRTVFPEQTERMIYERNTIFTECYNLAYTQHLKNKDIPEGGSKGLIFLKPYDRLDSESEIYKRELERKSTPPEETTKKLAQFQQEQTQEYLYQAQRSYVECLTTIVNCEPDGALKARRIVDYWKKPEYLYLGPDENMHDAMILWIAQYSEEHGYKPGTSFITSKPTAGINHKQYGVTSLGVNAYMREFLKYIGIDPQKEPFTIKIAGGPDGDVAGNQICNLFKYYPHTAKLLALIDISGAAYDPEGLDLHQLKDLFELGRPIAFYDRSKLHNGAYLIDKTKRKESTPIAQQIQLTKKVDGVLEEEWLSGSEVNHLLRETINKTKTDVFIPAGGRPRTLNESNWKDFLDENNKPTSKVIIEGANLYLNSFARRELEKLGCLIVRDSSANKTGVICSSFEVLCGLTLGDSKFVENKDSLVKEILERLSQLALSEAELLIREHQTSGIPLTEISSKVSERINQFTYQLLNHLDSISIGKNPKDPLVHCFLDYCPRTLQEHYLNELLSEIPDQHKKAIIACHVGARLVYKKGLHWFPSIVDILPLVLEELNTT